MKNLTKIFVFSLTLNVASCSSIRVLSEARKVRVEDQERSLSAVSFDYDRSFKVAKKSSKKSSNHLKKYFKEAPKKEKVKKNSFNEESQFKLAYGQKYFDFWVKYFTKKNKARFIRHLNNGEKYKQLVMNIFKEEGLPEELYYVGLIESGYNSRIKSRASATGYWQFMKGTGKDYGLKINQSVDERTNIHKSTMAAAQYFKDLYNIFGSWELVLCAYNAGEYRIIRAIRKGNTRDYHELVKKRLLPKETAYYIPKIMAARYLSRNLKLLKIKRGQIRSEDRDFTQAKVYSLSAGQTTLNKISKDLGLSYASVKKLNPDFNYKSLRGTRRRPLRVVLPKRKRGRELRINKIKVSKIITPSRRRVASNKKKKVYKVRRGDNLTNIARKFGVKLSDLKYVNSLNRKGKILIGQRIRIPASIGNFYIVRKGDNLTLIARKFNTSISRLLNLNGLKSKRIYPRQRLRVPSQG